MMSAERLNPNDSKIGNKLTKEEWLEFLNNYNERYFTRQQASGFTLWALVGVIVFIGSDLLKSLSAITNDFFLFSVFFTSFLNCYSIILCSNNVLDGIKINNYLESDFHKKWTRFYISLYFIVVAVVLGISLWQSEFVRIQGYLPYGYFVQAGIYGIYLITNLYRYVKHVFINNKSGPKLAFMSTGYEYKIIDAFGMTAFIICTIISINGLTWMMVVEHTNTLINSGELILLILAVRKLIDIIPRDEKIVSLERLEYEILLFDMDTEQIKKRFIEIWFDKSIVSYINEKEVERKGLIDKTIDLENQLLEKLRTPGIEPEELLHLHDSLNRSMHILLNQCLLSREEFQKLSLRIKGDEHLRIMNFLNEVDRQIQAINNAYANYSRMVKEYLTKSTDGLKYASVEVAATHQEYT